MKLYRLKHIPTGMYFTPSKGNGNLSKGGKIYVGAKPRVEWTETLRIKFYITKNISKQNKIIAEHFNLDLDTYSIDTYVKTNPEDWKIIEITE